LLCNGCDGARYSAAAAWPCPSLHSVLSAYSIFCACVFSCPDLAWDMVFLSVSETKAKRPPGFARPAGAVAKGHSREAQTMRET